MDFQFTILLGILTFLIQSALGGLFHGVSYSAVSNPSPLSFNFGRTFSSPSIIAHPPVAATYSTSRYTAYSLVPLTAQNVVTRQPSVRVGGLIRAFAVPSLSKHSGFSNSLLRQQGVTAYAAVPIAGYKAHFASPSIRSPSIRNFPSDLEQGTFYLPPPTSPDLQDYTPPIFNDQSTYGNFDNENSISVW